MGMPRACRVRQCLGRAAAHLLSTIVSVGGSDVEELGRHSWSEAMRGLSPSQLRPSCRSTSTCAQDDDVPIVSAEQLRHQRIAGVGYSTYLTHGARTASTSPRAIVDQGSVEPARLGFRGKETGQGEPGGTGILAVSSPKPPETARNRSITAGFGHPTASLGGAPSDVFTYALITDAETQP